MFCFSLQSSLFSCCSVSVEEQILSFLTNLVICHLMPKNTSYPTTLKAEARIRLASIFVSFSWEEMVTSPVLFLFTNTQNQI